MDDNKDKKEEEEVREEQPVESASEKEENIGNENVESEKATEEAPEVAAEEETTEEQQEPDPLDVALAEIENWKDKYLRSVAEFDNYRKRTIKEKAELILNGSEKAVVAILPVLDDMERALANADKTADADALKEGMDLIHKKFLKILEGLGVKPIDTTDQDFNVDYHDAIALVPGMGDDKKGKVIDCTEPGYMLNDKVIRHAKVAVGQ